MPAKTESQRRAAGAELNRRRQGGKRQQHATRPFGSAGLQDLKDFARKIGTQQSRDGGKR